MYNEPRAWSAKTARHGDVERPGLSRPFLSRPEPCGHGLLLVSGLLEGIGISTVLPLINLVVRGSLDSTGALGGAVERLMTLFGLKVSVGPLLALILAAFLFKAAIIYAAMRLAITTASGIVMEVRRAFLRSLLGARWEFFQSQPAGRLGGAISHEAEQVADLYLCACRMLAGAIQVAVYLGLAFTISWRLSLCALAVAGLGFAVLIRYVERMRRASTRFYERMRLLINGLIDALGGLKPLKAMGLESQDRALPGRGDRRPGDSIRPGRR